MGAPHRGWYIAFTLPRIRRMALSAREEGIETGIDEHRRGQNDSRPGVTDALSESGEVGKDGVTRGVAIANARGRQTLGAGELDIIRR